MINPLPATTLADLTRQTVDGFVTAQKALLDVMSKPVHEHHEHHEHHQPARKPMARRRAAAPKATPVPA